MKFATCDSKHKKKHWPVFPISYQFLVVVTHLFVMNFIISNQYNVY